MTKLSILLLRLAVLIIFSLAAPHSYAQDEPELLRRCGQTDFGLCGYIDGKIYEADSKTVFVIEPIYENARDFSESLAAVNVEGLWGYINSAGQIVISPQFQNAGAFDQGLAIAGTVEKLGVIDKSGAYVVEPTFTKAVVFSDEVLLAANDEAESQGRTRIPNALSSRFSSHDYDDLGLYHIEKGWLTEDRFNFSVFDPNKRDVFWAQIPFGKRGTFDDPYGLMRVDGSWVIKPKYSYGIELKNNRAPVRIIKNGETLSGAIDGAGNEVIPFKFDYLTHWGDGFLLAGKGAYPDRKSGIVNQNGELLAGRYFDEIKRKDNIFGPDDPDGDYFLVKDGDQWKNLFKDGTLLADQRAGKIYLKCDQFSIFYSTQGFDLRPKDQSLPDVSFESALFSSSDQECEPPPSLAREDSYAAVLEDGSVFGGFFENSKDFFGTHLWVNVDGKWGLVDRDGDFAINPIYNNVKKEFKTESNIFSRNQSRPIETTDVTYKVSIEENDFRLSFKDGEYLQTPFSEVKIDPRPKLNCRGGNKRKSKNGLWGIVDKDGKDIIAPKYRAISCFSGGVLWVPDDAKRQWCPLDKDGRVRTDPPCKDRHYSSWASHHYPEKLHEDPYESNVLWERAWLDHGEGRRDEPPKLVHDGYGG